MTSRLPSLEEATKRRSLNSRSISPCCNTGENLLAVEVHQANATSSDLTFDLELQGGSFNAGGSNIYYTLDGSDPRASGGGISPQAINFDGNPLTLDHTTIVKARVRNGSEWSPLSVAEFLVDPPATAGTLAITEINYNPHDSTDSVWRRRPGQ